MLVTSQRQLHTRILASGVRAGLVDLIHQCTVTAEEMVVHEIIQGVDAHQDRLGYAEVTSKT